MTILNPLAKHNDVEQQNSGKCWIRYQRQPAGMDTLQVYWKWRLHLSKAPDLSRFASSGSFSLERTGQGRSIRALSGPLSSLICSTSFQLLGLGKNNGWLDSVASWHWGTIQFPSWWMVKECRSWDTAARCYRPNAYLRNSSETRERSQAFELTAWKPLQRCTFPRWEKAMCCFDPKRLIVIHLISFSGPLRELSQTFWHKVIDCVAKKNHIE